MHFDTKAYTLDKIKLLNEFSRKFYNKDVITNDMKKLHLSNTQALDEYKFSNLTKDFRITSLSTDSANIKMWSHYANNNKGICIQYNLDTINKISRYIFPVLYMNDPIDVTDICEKDKDILLAVIISIISKFRDWETEKEWRVIFYLADSDQAWIQLINVPKPVCIFLGNKFIDNCLQVKKDKKLDELKLIEDFLKYVQESDIKIKIMKPQIMSYKLDKIDIKVDEILNIIK